MIHLPWIAATFALGLAIRYMGRRSEQRTIRLPDGRRLHLLSSVALLNGPTYHLLALEYVSALATPDLKLLEGEALALLQTVVAKPEHALCMAATVTAHLSEDHGEMPVLQPHVFSFRRQQAGADWQSVPKLE